MFHLEFEILSGSTHNPQINQSPFSELVKSTPLQPTSFCNIRLKFIVSTLHLFSRTQLSYILIQIVPLEDSVSTGRNM
jgi:hypothetical protein